MPYEDLLIYAKLRGRIPALVEPNDRTVLGDTFIYDCTIAPAMPLRVGLVVRVHEIQDPRRWGNPRSPYVYHAIDTRIVGTVTGIRTMERGITEFVLKHEDWPRRDGIHTVYITVPHLPGTTLELSRWQTLLRWALLPFLESARNLYLEENAKVIDDIVPRRSPSPRPSDCATTESLGNSEAGSDSD